MPELPEVEVARRAVEDHCTGKKIKRSVIADDSKVIDGVSPSDFQASLLGKTIVATHRKGKNMWLQLDSPPCPSFQFGMSGAVYIKGVAVTQYKRSAVNDADEWPSKYSKLFIELDDGVEFSFTDKRRFAKVRLLENPTTVPPISELGPDALFEPMTIDEFITSLSKKKIGIKALLLNQSFISGIGNWIADEVLYQDFRNRAWKQKRQLFLGIVDVNIGDAFYDYLPSLYPQSVRFVARIHPVQIASSLSKESCVALHKCIKEVIEKAIEVGADSSQFPSNWIFHSREKKPGKAFVDGNKIEFITAGGRTTAYVPEFQKLSGSQASEASKPKKRTVKGNKDEDSDDDALESEEEGNANKNSKSKGGKRTRQGRKAPPARGKYNRSDKDDDENSSGDGDGEEENTNRKKKTRTENAPTKRKSKAATETRRKGGRT